MQRCDAYHLRPRGGGVGPSAAPPGPRRRRGSQTCARRCSPGGRAVRAATVPRNVNWIDGGRRYSYIQQAEGGEQIRVFRSGERHGTVLLFQAKGLTFPDTAEPFAYRSFQWARDSKHLVFDTHFKQL